MDKTIFVVGSIIQFENRVGKILYIDRVFEDNGRLKVAVTCKDMKTHVPADDFYCIWPEFEVLEC